MASVTPAETVETEADVKPLRADAQRNYDKLVAAAREVFAERGAEGRSTRSPSGPASDRARSIATSRLVTT